MMTHTLPTCSASRQFLKNNTAYGILQYWACLRYYTNTYIIKLKQTWTRVDRATSADRFTAEWICCANNVKDHCLLGEFYIIRLYVRHVYLVPNEQVTHVC